MTCALRGEKPPKEKPKCSICGKEIRVYFTHFYREHPKGDLIKLILKLLKIPKSEWHKRTY